MSEDFFPVPQIWAQGALMDRAAREADYARSIADSHEYWMERAQRLGVAYLPTPNPTLEIRAGDVIALVARSEAVAQLVEGEALERLDGYDLFRRNCATELLRALDPGDGRILLGKRVDPDGPLHFVPALAFEGAARHDLEVSAAVIPSFRSRRLDAMRRREGRGG